MPEAMTVRQRTEHPAGLRQAVVMLDQTFTHNVAKPWGSTDLRPWSEYHDPGEPVGEVWFELAAVDSHASALQLKILFTTSPLSIQVHPDDAFAHSIGLAHGKSEAWYILSAQPNAKVALGLKRRVGAPELRAAISAGTITDLIQWRSVKSGDLIYVPAGTIHAIGPGLVLVEIQQRSDATFRLFDFGRRRELHIEHGVAAARGEQAARQVPLRKLTKERTLLIAGASFVIERVELPPGSDWELTAATETWLFVLKGGTWVGILDARENEAIFVEADSARLRVRAAGLAVLVAYAGSEPLPGLLRSLEGHSAGLPNAQRDVLPVAPSRA